MGAGRGDKSRKGARDTGGEVDLDQRQQRSEGVTGRVLT